MGKHRVVRADLHHGPRLLPGTTANKAADRAQFPCREQSMPTAKKVAEELRI